MPCYHRQCTHQKEEEKKNNNTRLLLLFMAHHPPHPPPHWLWNDKYQQKVHFYHSGSQAAGYAPAWRQFLPALAHTLDAFVRRGLFVGEDQILLQATCQRHANYCAYITFDQVPDNHYFGLRHVLHHFVKQKKRRNGAKSLSPPPYRLWRPPAVVTDPTTTTNDTTTTTTTAIPVVRVQDGIVSLP